jgi:hypothetical protein
MDVQFRWTDQGPAGMSVTLGTYDQRILSGLFSIMDLFSAQVEAVAKQMGQWSDQTGAARQGIRSFVERGAAGAVLYLVHSVFYGIFLELGTRFMGPYPALGPALESIYGPMASAIRALVGG